jgi:hypothetical protein
VQVKRFDDPDKVDRVIFTIETSNYELDKAWTFADSFQRMLLEEIRSLGDELKLSDFFMGMQTIAEVLERVKKSEL